MSELAPGLSSFSSRYKQCVIIKTNRTEKPFNPMLPEKLNAGHAQAVHSGIGLAMQKCFEYATDRHCTVERVPLRAGKPEAFSQELSEKFIFQYKACLD